MKWRNKSPQDGITDFEDDKKHLADTDFKEKKLKLKKGEIASQHHCPHDEDPSQWFNCRDDPRAEYVEFEKKV